MKSFSDDLARSVSGAVLLLLVVSCNGDNSPTAPVVPSNRTGFVSGFAHLSSGVCLSGAVVEILDGPRAGIKVTQADPCGAIWDYSGGYAFSDLPANTTVRMRASKEGYVAMEMTFSTSGLAGQSNFLMVPK